MNSPVEMSTETEKWVLTTTHCPTDSKQVWLKLMWSLVPQPCVCAGDAADAQQLLLPVPTPMSHSSFIDSALHFDACVFQAPRQQLQTLWQAGRPEAALMEFTLILVRFRQWTNKRIQDGSKTKEKTLDDEMESG